MAADSNTQLDIIEWIEKIVDSCENGHHFSNTRELVYLFEKALELEGMSFEVRQFLTNRLLDKIYNKESNFIQK
jgi:hypothetical protein